MAKGHDMSGKVAVLTGGDSGIALPTSISLAASGAVVILATHNQEHGDAVAANITRRTGNERVSALHIDLSSFASVRKFASAVVAKHKVIDILINDAGIDGENPQRMTADGFEECAQVNYLGHVLLTELLLPALRASQASRVINMASLMASMLPCMQTGRAESCLADADGWKASLTTFAKHPTGYLPWWMSRAWERTANLTASNYALTKFMLVAHAKALAEREAALGTSVRAFAMRPGIVQTHLLRRMSYGDCETGCLMEGYRGCIKGVCPLSPEQGAATLTMLAVDDTAALSTGGYFYQCGSVRHPITPHWNWETAPKQLFEASLTWVGANTSDTADRRTSAQGLMRA